MKNVRRIALYVLCNLFAYYSFAQSDIHVTDYGAVPNSFRDATENVRQAIEACRNKPESRLIFAPGRYDFWPDKAEKREYFISNTSAESECPSKIKTIGLLFENIKDLTVEGNGSLFVFHGKMTTWVLDHCENIRLQNFAVDFERPSMSEMKFMEVTPNRIIAEVHPDSKFTIIDEKLHWYGEGWGMNHYHVILQDTLAGTGIYSSWNPIAEGKTTALDLNKIRIEGDFSETNYKTGQILTVRDPIRDQVGTFVNLSKHIMLENITMHYMHGLGIVSQFSENLSYRHIHVVSSKGRAVATFADAMHFSGCKGNIRIKECHFKGLHDDPVNVHGTYLRITEIHSPNRLTVRFMHGQSYGFPAFFEKDTIAFIHGKSLQTCGTAQVIKADLVSEREMQIELNAPLPRKLSVGDCLENLTWTPSLEVRNCRFERTNTRGMLVTTPRKVVIENNVFYRTGMYGILIAGDAGSWYESGAVKDVLIRNNMFDGCGFNMAGNSYTISVEPENHEKIPGYQVHRNIRIENNRMEVLSGQIVRARSVNGLIIDKNKISLSSLDTPLHEEKKDNASFRLENCTNVIIKDNDIRIDPWSVSVSCSGMKKRDIKTDIK